MIELRTLGALELIASDGGAIPSVLAQPRRAALLCYLALASPRGFHRRDSLYALFWPEHDAEHARHALRQSLYFLRHALGSSTITSRGDGALALAADAIGCDAWEFERAVNGGHAEAALTLYRGDLLSGFHISDAPDFEDWLGLERERLKRRAGEAAWALAEARERAGDATGAEEAGRRAAALAPGDETGLRRLLVLLDRLGDSGGAVRAYEAFASNLKRDYELQPSEETRALLSKIRSRPLSAPLASAASPPASTGMSATAPLPATPGSRTSGRWRGAITWRPGAPRRDPRRRVWAAGALIGVGLLLWGAWHLIPRAHPRTHPPRSIAVLPFRNLGADSTGDYFTDGVTEEILHALAQIPDLRVAARTSAFQFRGKEVDVREVGDRLDVAAVLEGSIQREGDAIRMTMRLIDTRTGYQFWSGKFDRNVAELFAVEDEVARVLADTLEVALGLVARPGGGTPGVEAHDLYFRGLSLMAQRGPALRQAITYFNSALAGDSTFALAWAALAAAYELLPAYYLSSYEEALPQAERAARLAIAVDSTLGPAYAVLASVYRDRMRWVEADRYYGRALRLAPNDPEIIEQYGQLLFWSGQAEAALPWMERARKLDPLAPIPATTTGVAHLFLHQYDSAAALLRHASKLAPTLPLPYMWRMWTELSAGRFDSAQQAGRRLAEVTGLDPDLYSGLIRGVADPLRRREALALLARTPETAPWALNTAYRVNWLMLLGDTAAALDAVDRLKTQPYFNGILTLWNPPLDPIRDHPRFRLTLQRLGLPSHGGGHL